MVRSMTGFGHSEKITKDYKVTVEIKSVNHRYCDMNIKMPKKFNAFESKLRNVMKNYVNRGKIDVYISFENYSDNDVRVQYHSGIARDYVQAIREAKNEFALEEGLTGTGLVRFPEVITLEENSQDLDSIYPAIEETLEEAGKQFLEAREIEGAHLRKDILTKLDFITELVAFVEERSPQMLEEYRGKIMNKVAELLGDNKVDEGVLATEITIYADKVCVDEETVRLHSHISNMQNTLNKDEPIGRKLDFIAQEMNREANTILSKANDKELSQNAIDLKTEIEKIREQIQNIE